VGNVIEAANLTKHYEDLLAVDHIDFQVEQGEIFGFLGPNGAGKTTTIRMLTGLTKPTAGSLRIADIDMIREPNRAKSLMGVVPEVSNVYDEMSAWDNLVFAGQLYGAPKNEREKKAKELLELFSLYERRADRTGTLSKGMKRRLTIAAALIHNPSILFLDEPTSGLDVQSSRIIRNLTRDLNRSGVTVFLTTHYIEEADHLCQRVAMINQGKLVAVDNPEKLKASVEKHQILEVSFDRSLNLEPKLAQLECVSRVVQAGDKFTLHVTNTSEAAPLLVDFARENSLKIVSISTLNPSLEDAFVEMTGLNPDVMKTEKEQVKKGASLG
jgi:ABC-2 type transport system ATP-binding protein